MGCWQSASEKEGLYCEEDAVQMARQLVGSAVLVLICCSIVLMDSLEKITKIVDLLGCPLHQPNSGSIWHQSSQAHIKFGSPLVTGGLSLNSCCCVL